MYHNVFIHSSVDGHLGCFHVLIIIKSAANEHWRCMNLLESVFSRHMPTSGISWVIWKFYFCFLRNLHIVLHNGLTNLHYHQQCRKENPVFFPHTVTVEEMLSFTAVSRLPLCHVSFAASRIVTTVIALFFDLFDWNGS